MERMAGLCYFCIALGMIFMFFIQVEIIAIIIIIVLMFVNSRYVIM